MKLSKAFILLCLFSIIFLIFLIFFLKTTRRSSQMDTHPSLSSWITITLKLPSNRASEEMGLEALGGSPKTRASLVFDMLHKASTAMVKPLLDPDNWLKKKGGGVWDLKAFEKERFQPYAQKIVLKKDVPSFIFGDLHGDIRTPVKFLKRLLGEGKIDEEFRFTETFNLIFLGDLTDRGKYGFEVIYTLSRLKAMNPDRVFLSRGNHEDLRINKGKFLDEAYKKLDGPEGSLSKAFKRHLSLFYESQPVALFLGDGEHFLQACHGGLEPGYWPESFLDEEAQFDLVNPLDRDPFYQKLRAVMEGQEKLEEASKVESIRVGEDYIWMKGPRDISAPYEDVKGFGSLFVGFMWNDFVFKSDEKSLKKFFYGFKARRGFSHGRSFTYEALKILSPKLRGVIRAHQHGEEDVMAELKRTGGIFRYWRENPDWEENRDKAYPVTQGSVFMFNLGCDSRRCRNEGIEERSSYGELGVGETLEDWKMKIRRL